LRFGVASVADRPAEDDPRESDQAREAERDVDEDRLELERRSRHAPGVGAADDFLERAQGLRLRASLKCLRVAA